MKQCLVFFSLLFLWQHSHAQTEGTYTAAAADPNSYDRAIGIKFPGGLAVTYKQFLTDCDNIEGEGMFWEHGFRAVGLYEFNFDIEGIEGLRWYVGPGAHVGFWNSTYRKDHNLSSAGIGIDGVLGLDYKFSNLPLNLSLDWQSGFDIIGNSSSNAAYGGIGVRYTF